VAVLAFFFLLFGRARPILTSIRVVCRRNRPILIRLSAITPKPTQRCIRIPGYDNDSVRASFEHANATFHSRSPLLASSEERFF